MVQKRRKGEEQGGAPPGVGSVPGHGEMAVRAARTISERLYGQVSGRGTALPQEEAADDFILSESEEMALDHVLGCLLCRADLGQLLSIEGSGREIECLLVRPAIEPFATNALANEAFTRKVAAHVEGCSSCIAEFQFARQDRDLREEERGGAQGLVRAEAARLALALGDAALCGEEGARQLLVSWLGRGSHSVDTRQAAVEAARIPYKPARQIAERMVILLGQGALSETDHFTVPAQERAVRNFANALLARHSATLDALHLEIVRPPSSTSLFPRINTRQEESSLSPALLVTQASAFAWKRPQLFAGSHVLRSEGNSEEVGKPYVQLEWTRGGQLVAQVWLTAWEEIGADNHALVTLTLGASEGDFKEGQAAERVEGADHSRDNLPLPPWKAWILDGEPQQAIIRDKERPLLVELTGRSTGEETLDDSSIAEALVWVKRALWVMVEPVVAQTDGE